MSKIRFQNVHFFRKKGQIDEIQISRGVHIIWLGITFEGAAVVKMKGFDRYYFCPETNQVYSRVKCRHYRPIKRHEEQGKPFYFLYFNGERRRVPFYEILRDNMKGIELFFSEENRDGRKVRHNLEIVS